MELMVKTEIEDASPPADYLDESAMDFNNDLLEEEEDDDVNIDLAAIDEATDGILPESAFCRVCGDSATGMYFGALVCVPCKTFFLRYASDSFTFSCKFNGACKITPSNRTQCKFCRYQKCVEAGMCRRGMRPMQVHLNEGQQLCAVCSDVANGVHFGALTCEGCKKFFRRGLVEHNSYSCKGDMNCVVNPRTRNACRYCRYIKCLSVGMSRDAIQMGRPSKHKAHLHASIRRSLKEAKAMKMEKEEMAERKRFNNTAATTAWRQRSSDSSTLQSSPETPADFPKYAVDWITGDTYGDLSSEEVAAAAAAAVRRMSFGNGSVAASADTVAVNSDSNSSAEVARLNNSSLLSPQSDVSGGTRRVDSISECGERVPPISAGQHKTQGNVVDGSSDARFTVDWRKAAGVGDAGRARVWSGGYCCEVGTAQNHDQFDPIICNGEKFIDSGGKWKAYNERKRGNSLTMQLSSPSDVFDSDSLTTDGKQPAGASAFAPRHLSVDCSSYRDSVFTGKAMGGNNSSQQQHRQSSVECHRSSVNSRPDDIGAYTTSHRIYSEGAVTPTAPAAAPVTVRSPDDAVSSVHSPCRETSPGLKWSMNSDRDSPYISVMQLASRYQQLNEVSPSRSSETDAASKPDDVSPERVTEERNYWLFPELPDENVLFSEKHCTMINRITAAYDRFVQTGTIINETLSSELNNWRQQNIDNPQSLPGWIQQKVIPVYTVTSITYCKSIPGFVDFVPEDQATLIRLGQSPSRILVACIHWYDPERQDFHNFLSWRTDLFKKKLISVAQKISTLDIDHIEAAVLNALVLIATDYRGLKNPSTIDDLRMDMLNAFRAYTTAKLGTPNRRIETLFSYIPEIRQLGMLHYKMTMTPSLRAEDLHKS